MWNLKNVGVLAVLAAVAFWNAAGQSGNEPSVSVSQKAHKLDADPHLVAWWKFDETSGKKAADSSGHGHDGVLEGAFSFETHSAVGQAGRALKLDAQDRWVRVPGYKGVTGTAARTVCAWVKTTVDRGEIVSWGADEHGKMWIFGHVRGRIGVTPKGGYLYMNDSIADDTWHHVAVVVNEADPPNLHDHVRLFKDGAPAVIHDIGLLDLWPIETGSELEVRIGRGFKGLIDDLRVYDRALSEDELNALFKCHTQQR